MALRLFEKIRLLGGMLDAVTGRVQSEDVDYDNTISGLTSTTVKGAIDEVAGATGGADDQIASEVPFSPVGALSGTNVQMALEELDTEKSGTGHDHSGAYDASGAAAAAQSAAIRASSTWGSKW